MTKKQNFSEMLFDPTNAHENQIKTIKLNIIQIIYSFNSIFPSLEISEKLYYNIIYLFLALLFQFHHFSSVLFVFTPLVQLTNKILIRNFFLFGNFAIGILPFSR